MRRTMHRPRLVGSLLAAGALAFMGLSAPPGGAQPVTQDRADPLPFKNRVTITEKDGVRTIVSNGIPDHQPGQFPSRGNPNTISEQDYRFSMPLNPTLNEGTTAHRQRWMGVAVNGVPFEPGTAEAWKNDPGLGWRIEAIQPAAGRPMLGLDASNAHVQPGGQYHYHGLPAGLMKRLSESRKVKPGESMLLVGWAADGFPMYAMYGHAKADDASSPVKELRSSWKLKRGARPGGEQGPGGTFDGTYTEDYEFVAGSGDLDACNGRTGVTPEYPKGTYYYVITGEFPFVTRQLHGTPDASFGKGDHRRGGPGGPGGPGGAGRGNRGGPLPRGQPGMPGGGPEGP